MNMKKTLITQSDSQRYKLIKKRKKTKKQTKKQTEIKAKKQTEIVSQGIYSKE